MFNSVCSFPERKINICNLPFTARNIYFFNASLSSTEYTTIAVHTKENNMQCTLTMILKKIHKKCCLNELKNRNRIWIPSDHRRITEFLRTKNTDKTCLTKSHVFNYNNYIGHSIQGSVGKEKDRLVHSSSFHYKMLLARLLTK